MNNPADACMQLLDNGWQIGLYREGEWYVAQCWSEAEIKAADPGELLEDDERHMAVGERPSEALAELVEKISGRAGW